jgi:alkanesulfonate monooxygenase SsuD/methylene tetrahydromethanopterin reductase-like flavin-dependent oxidoreductase (luciferase family)
MKFGLFYQFSDFGNIPQDQLFQEILEEIAYGEELGFDSVWLSEHHFAVYGTLGNPLTLAAAITQRTRRMQLGTAVMVLPFHHPLRLAEEAALVDVLSQGRLLLGVGRGFQPPEFHGFGTPQQASREVFLESFEIVRRALSGETFVYDGKFWHIREPTEIFPKPIQKPHPPFYLAAISPSTYDMAAHLGLPLLRAPQFSNLDTVARAFTAYKDEMRAYGYDPDTLDQPLAVRVYVAPTDAEAKAEAKHALWFYHLLATLLPGAPGRPKPAGYEHYPQDPTVLATLTLEDVWERGTCLGAPERVLRLMQRYRERSGTTHWMIQMRLGGLEHDKVLRSMELFAREVMPALRGAATGDTPVS